MTSFITQKFIITISRESMLGVDFYEFGPLLLASRLGLYLPLLGLIFLFFVPARYTYWLRALVATLLTVQLLMHFYVCYALDFSAFAPFYFSVGSAHFGFFRSNFGYMIDSTSVFFYLLVPALLFLCVVSSVYIVHRVKLFLILLLVLDYTLLNVFLSFDYLHFIVFVELSIIPMFFLISVWGSRTRSTYSSYVYVLISLLSSVFFISAIIVLTSHTGDTSLFRFYGIELSDHFFSGCRFGLAYLEPSNPEYFFYRTQVVAFSLLFISLAMKMPVFPFHIWLPEAHGEASTVGSVVLAGLFLKMAGFGIFRYLLPFFPEAYHLFKPFGFAVGLLGLLYCSIILFRQLDLKKFIAYSSVVHMNLMVVAIFTSSSVGILGAYYSMLVHSVVASLLFFLAGLIYDRYHTRNILQISTLSNRAPLLATFLYAALLSNVAFPFTANFVAELCMLTGVVQAAPFIGLISAVGVALTAVSHFYLIGRFLADRPSLDYELLGRESSGEPTWDGSSRDMLHLYPLFFLVLHMNFASGLYFSFFAPNLAYYFLFL